jgi:hypothetical protein
MFCETFIAFLSRTCSKTVGFVTSHGDVDVDKDGFTTIMFELGKTYPPLTMRWAMNGSLKGQFMTWIDVMQDEITMNKRWGLY